MLWTLCASAYFTPLRKATALPMMRTWARDYLRRRYGVKSMILADFGLGSGMSVLFKSFTIN